MSLIVGENLLQLNRRHRICPEDSFDGFSLKLTLSVVVFVPREDVEGEIDYANDDAVDLYEQREIGADGIVLSPNQCLLGCSNEFVKMPNGVFGLIQTKGSLARLFVSIHQTDAQVEPGFEGAITFEIKNHSPHRIRLRRYDNVAQLFLWMCTTDNAPPYSGKYSRSRIPTVKILRRSDDFS